MQYNILKIIQERCRSLMKLKFYSNGNRLVGLDIQLD